MTHLADIFSEASQILEPEPEELASTLLQTLPPEPGAKFCLPQFLDQLYSVSGGGLPHHTRNDVEVALAEAIEWLRSQGLVIRDPGQSPQWFQLTRRARKIKAEGKLQEFRTGQILPVHLLPESLVVKVRHLFLRGDHDTAVFQAFKEVEVAVRQACGYGNEQFGKALMIAAFNPKDGPLSDQSLVTAEREAEMSLFVGAVGHAKNPTSHRDVDLSPEEAARLIVFAAHLLSIVETRRQGRGAA